MSSDDRDTVAARSDGKLWLVRHGQSAGNVAAEQASSAGLATIEIAGRDVDVPLSQLGERQAHAVGHWFARLDADARPTLICASPYRRARATAEHIADAVAIERGRILVDERLREKELGALNRLTKRGITERFPEEVERRRLLGKFYYRPPGGESWCDVLLRLRAALDNLARDFRGERILVVSHQVIVSCTRYLLERLDEHERLESDRAQPVPNCSVTAWDFPAGYLRRAPVAPSLLYHVAPLAQEGAPITVESDAARAQK